MQAPRTSEAVEPVPEVIDSFSGGMRDRDHRSLIDANQYARGVNIEIREAGLAKTRDGTQQPVGAAGSNPQGIVYFQPSTSIRRLVQVNGGLIFTWSGSGGSWTRLGAIVLNNQTLPVEFVILNGVLYLFPGTSDNVYSWDGSAADFTDEGNADTDPPRTSIVCQQAGRLCAQDDTNLDQIDFSDIFDGHTWDQTLNNKRAPTDGSEVLTALALYRKEEILAWTRNSTQIFNIEGSNLSNFTRTTLDPKIGCVAPRSVVVVSDDAFFLSPDKQLRTIKRTVQDLAFGVSLPVSDLVPNLFARINRNYVHKCAAIHFNNYYLLAAPMDDYTTNSSIIAFDMLHQRQSISGSVPVCVGEWTNLFAGQFVITNFSDRQELYFMDSRDGRLWKMFANADSDFGTSIESIIEFRAPDWKMPRNDKTMHNAELQFIDSYGSMVLAYARDDASFTDLVTVTIGNPNAPRLEINLPFFLGGADGVLYNHFQTFYRRGRSRSWQLKLTFSSGIMNLKQVTYQAWIEGAMTR